MVPRAAIFRFTVTPRAVISCGIHFVCRILEFTNHQPVLCLARTIMVTILPSPHGARAEVRVEVLPRGGDGRSEERDRHAVPEQAPEHRHPQGSIRHQDGGEETIALCCPCVCMCGASCIGAWCRVKGSFVLHVGRGRGRGGGGFWSSCKMRACGVLPCFWDPRGFSVRSRWRGLPSVCPFISSTV